MYDIEEKFEELEKICDRLKRECHHEDCKDVYQCPERHVDCQVRLDIYTALLWELSIVIQKFGFSSNFSYHYEIRRDFDTLRYVLGYHRKKYEEVYDYLNTASLIMLKIIMAEKDLVEKDLENRLHRIFW